MKEISMFIDNEAVIPAYDLFAREQVAVVQVAAPVSERERQFSEFVGKYAPMPECEKHGNGADIINQHFHAALVDIDNSKTPYWITVWKS